jgi:hypothetical protein
MMANFEHVELLRAMFPQTKQEVLQRALENSDTMDAAVDAVLALRVRQDNEPGQRIVQREAGPRDADDFFVYDDTFRQLPFRDEDDITDLISPKSPKITTKKAQLLDLDALPEDHRQVAIQAIRDMFPDCDPDFIINKLDTLEGQDAVVDVILETRGAYPKRGTLKRKRSDEPEEQRKKKDYSAKEATLMDTLYQKQCHALLMKEFPRIPTDVLERIQEQNNHQYAPSYIYLINASRIAREIPEQSSFSLLKTPRKIKKPNVGHERLLEEEEWVNGWLDEQRKLPQGPPVTDPDMECSCCYNDVPMSQMTTCQDGHLFCFDCAKRHVAEIIGLRKTIIPCMSSEGCEYDFPPSEVRRFLDEKTLMGWEKLNQEIALKNAGIDGFEECPFCSFGIIIPTTKEQDKLFHCKNDECGRVSCRLCQKENHLPSTCEEAADDNVLGAQHQVEEAMTNALLRSCAKCQKKFYKTEGCNKMACPECHAITCYVCQQDITKQGYGHFNNNRNPNAAANGKCILFDDTGARNANDINAAHERIMKELQQTASGVIDKIKVDTVVAPVVSQNPMYGGIVPNREVPPPFELPPLEQLRHNLHAHYQHVQTTRDNYPAALPGTGKKAERTRKLRVLNQRLNNCQNLLRTLDHVIAQHPALVQNYNNRNTIDQNAKNRAFAHHHLQLRAWQAVQAQSGGEMNRPII